MYRIVLGAAALARVRFVISPLATAESVLGLRRRAPAPGMAYWTRLGHEAIRDKRLHLLGALYSRQSGYVPDLLNPEPAAFLEDPATQLHEVATTPAERVRAEFRAVLEGIPQAGVPARRMPRAFLRCVEAGEAELTGRLADEMAQFWQYAIAPGWPELRARMDADVSRRAQLVARHGMAAMLSALHPSLAWRDGELQMDSPFHAHLQADTVLLSPGALRPALDALIDVTPLPRKRLPSLCYPAYDAGRRESSRPPPGHELLGSTRAVLLADLAVPRSTTELAGRHDLSPATVSHHLGVLHRSGLVTRRRAARWVLYQQTPQAAELLN